MANQKDPKIKVVDDGKTTKLVNEDTGTVTTIIPPPNAVTPSTAMDGNPVAEEDNQARRANLPSDFDSSSPATYTNNMTTDYTNPMHTIPIHIEGDVIEDGVERPELKKVGIDHYEGILLGGEEVPENPYGDTCEQAKDKILEQVNQAQYKLMEKLTKDPLTVEEEVDGMRVKHSGLKGTIDLMNYLNSMKAGTALSGVRYFRLRAEGYN